MIFLTQFHSPKSVETKRKAKCKNCMGDPWSKKTAFNLGEYRVVIKSGGMGHRHLSLCRECAAKEADRLEDLARAIRKVAV